MIHVVAILTAKPGQRAAVLELFQANVPAVRENWGDGPPTSSSRTGFASGSKVVTFRPRRN